MQRCSTCHWSCRINAGKKMYFLFEGSQGKQEAWKKKQVLLLSSPSPFPTGFTPSVFDFAESDSCRQGCTHLDQHATPITLRSVQTSCSYCLSAEPHGYYYHCSTGGALVSSKKHFCFTLGIFLQDKIMYLH